MDDQMEQISQHLEYLGYTISPAEERSFHARHPSKANILVRSFAGGCLITAWYGTTADSLVNREGFLEVLNSLNAQAIVSRYYVDKEYDFAVETFFHPPYDRSSFAQFMDLWDRDFARMLESDVDQYLT